MWGGGESVGEEENRRLSPHFGPLLAHLFSTPREAKLLIRDRV